jgi:hypothetical protein
MPPITALLAALLLFSLPALATAAPAPAACGAYAQACCGAQRKCNAGFECRGSCQPLHKADKDAPLGARSTRVVLINQTPFTLTYAKAGATHGAWTQSPPAKINGYDYGQWQTDSNGFLTGTEARAIYQIVAPGRAAPVGTTEIGWDNPFSGGNTYKQTASTGFAVDRRGGEGNHTTIFFFLRGVAQPPYPCADLWVANHLWTKPNPVLHEVDEAIGIVTTAIKKQGIEGWTYTGCGTQAEAVAVRDAQHSTDGYWTIDVWLTSFRVGSMNGIWNLHVGEGRAIRIEAKPGTKAHDVLNDDEDLRPRKGDKLRLSGPLYIDHGHFVEIHPEESITITSR